MLDADHVKNSLRTFVCTELIRNADYALGDDEALVTGGLIDSFSIAQIGVFVEKAFGVYVPDTDLTVENMDDLVRMTRTVLAHADDEGRG
jgi:acyl carrier protein